MRLPRGFDDVCFLTTEETEAGSFIFTLNMYEGDCCSTEETLTKKRIMLEVNTEYLKNSYFDCAKISSVAKS